MFIIIYFSNLNDIIFITNILTFKKGKKNYDYLAYEDIRKYTYINMNCNCYRHPDKSEDPNAESRFVEIKQAYELLSDSERRNAYDLYGITNEDEHLYKQRHDYTQYARFRYIFIYVFLLPNDQLSMMPYDFIFKILHVCRGS